MVLKLNRVFTDYKNFLGTERACTALSRPIAVSRFKQKLPGEAWWKTYTILAAGDF
jgi:hypothetical protein